ncbi:MAG TPA: hypothetical protein VM408_07025, partial [Methylomirabilota bacterium]|nr:hypothetical protein [Methylomirabilota bacterium]
MPDHSSPRRLATIWLMASLALTVAACSLLPSAAPAVPVPAAPTAPPDPAATGDPGAAIDVDALLANAGAQDGQTVRVTGNFLADAGSAQLCAVLMESYPPQCGGGLRLTGSVPADTLAA